MRGPQVRFCERRGGATRCAYSTSADCVLRRYRSVRVAGCTRNRAAAVRQCFLHRRLPRQDRTDCQNKRKNDLRRHFRDHFLAFLLHSARFSDSDSAPVRKFLSSGIRLARRARIARRKSPLRDSGKLDKLEISIRNRVSRFNSLATSLRARSSTRKRKLCPKKLCHSKGSPQQFQSNFSPVQERDK